MRRFFSVQCIIGLLMLSIGLASQAANDTHLTFKNQRGSELILNWDNSESLTGSLSGSFKTVVGDCEEDMNVHYPLNGYFNKNTISLAINFPHCNQVLVMTGHMSDDRTKISMMWLDTKVSNDPKRKDWNTNIIGTDKYKRIH